jgi:hypothetical protein
MVPSNTLERYSIGSRVVNGVRILVISSNMAKLVGCPTSDSTFTYQKGAKNTSFVSLLLNNNVVDSHSLHKNFHTFWRWCLVKELSLPSKLPLSIILISNLSGRTYTQSGTFWYRCPTIDSWSSIHQKDGHAQLQIIEIYVANSHR